LLFTFAINLWHRKFLTADVTGVFVNNQHGIQRRRQDFDKKFGRQLYKNISMLFLFPVTRDLLFTNIID